VGVPVVPRTTASASGKYRVSFDDVEALGKMVAFME